MNYTHLSIEERCCLREYYNRGYSYRKIGELLGRDASTICREVNRNKTFMNVKPALLSAYGTEEVPAAQIVLSQRDVPGSCEAGLHKGAFAADLVTGTDRQHPMGEGTSVCPDDLSVDLREIH